MKAKVIFMSVALIAMVSTLSAQTTKKQATQTPTQTCRNYVDVNNDKICDSHGNHSGNGQGLKDGSGRKNGQGKGLAQGKKDGSGNGVGKGNFKDTNKNGVCNHKE